MEEDRERIEDLMRRYGFEEGEARAAYRLNLARDAFEGLYEDEPGSRAANAIYELVFVTSHFKALNDYLARRVLERGYPEGWGRGRAPEREEGPG
jgi:hypothetical protein